MPTDNHDSDINDTLLSRYLAGESTPAERARVDAWLAADPTRRVQLAAIADAWQTAGRPRGHETPNVDAAWRRMSADLDRVQSPRVWTRPAWRIAAGIVLVAGAFGAWALASGRLGRRAETIYVTAVGAREAISTTDGTRIDLAPASRLVLAADFGRASRDVTLHGEALFAVQHDAAKPFRVHVGDAIVEDLGTEFGVRFYEATDTLRVVVTSGVVMFARAAAPNDTLGIVRAGQIGLLTANGDALVSTISNASELLAWSNGRLVFDNTPMSRVAVELRRWYDVDVVVDSALAARHVTVDFAGDSLSEVARVIAATIGARVEQKGRTLSFSSDRSK